MNKEIMVFSKEWFEKNQKILLFWLNSKVFGYIIRLYLKIDCKEHIKAIQTNYIDYLDKREFRTHEKYAKLLYYKFYYLWQVFHFLDWLLLERFERLNKYDLGFATLTYYSDTGIGGTTCDGLVSQTGNFISFSDIRNGAGNAVDNTSTFASVRLNTNSSANFSILSRFGATFDTSSIGSGTTVSGVTLSVFGSKFTELGTDPNLHVISFSPAINNQFFAGDYDSVGATTYANKTYASFSTTVYNDFVLNSNGVSNLNKTGISKYAMRLDWDLNNSFLGDIDSNSGWGFIIYTADDSGTSRDPKLIVTMNSVNVSFNENISVTETLDKERAKEFSETVSIKQKLRADGEIPGLTFFESITINSTFGQTFDKILTDSVKISTSLKKFLNGDLVGKWTKLRKTVSDWTEKAKTQSRWRKSSKK